MIPIKTTTGDMMKKLIVPLLFLTFFNPFSASAAMQVLGTKANTAPGHLDADANFVKQNANNAELQATKADKDKVVRYWADHPDGAQIDAKTLVAYDGKIYTTLQDFDKVSSSATPDVLTAYFKVAGVTNYAELDGKPTLGTAAALNVGSTPGSVLQLDNEGKLPAIDASRVTGIAGTIPSGSTTGQTVEWDATNNIWTPVDWNTLSADGSSLTISSGVLSVAGATSSANSSVLGRNSHGVFGFNPISDYVTTSGLLPVTQEDDPTASAANGIYVATGSNKVFIKSATGLVSWAATITPWDTTPDQWFFTDQVDASVSTSVLSNEVTVSGIDYKAPISATGDPGCGYSKNSLPCSESEGTVVSGDKIKACVTTSQNNNSLATCTLLSDGIIAPFRVTTSAALSSWIIEDNFDADTITNYIRFSGTAVSSISNGALHNATGEGSVAWLRNTIDLGSANQTVQAIIQDRIGVTSGAGSGVVIRSNGITGHGCWIDVGSSRFTCEALGGSGTNIYKSFTNGAWVADASHLVEVSVGSDDVYHFKVDFNDDGDFIDANEDIGASSANSSFSGTYVGVGFKNTGTNEIVDSFKAKVYNP